MTPDWVWTLLVNKAGALEGERAQFLSASNHGPELEFRFRGHLGFGGKVRRYWRGGVEFWRVDYYMEDKTSARDAIAAEVNISLKEMFV
jgi:hypothetical protein